MVRLFKWPLSPLVAWCFIWLLFELLSGFLPFNMAAAFSCLAGILVGGFGSTPARRIALAAGFPLSLVILQSVPLPMWLWACCLLFGLLLYPVQFWKDAPLFPTPSGALVRLSEVAVIPDRACVLDAGCGLGDALIALRQAYPRAQYFGVEASFMLVGMAWLRCPWSKIWQGDIWTEPWMRYGLVYLFQRPETMSRAVDKASRELIPGALMVSLEFAAIDLEPYAVLAKGTARPVWIYRQPFIYAKPAVST